MKKLKNIAILGAGNLGLAIADGLQRAGFLADRKLFLTRRNTRSIESWKSDNVEVTSDNKYAVAGADIVLLCVQPHQIEHLLKELRPVLDSDRHILVSVITAVGIEQLSSYAGGPFPIIRAMPNTAISVRESMTCMAHNGVAESVQTEVENIFACVGKTLWIEEPLMQAATVVCASGIAFWMRFIRATMQGGVQLGFDAHDAKEIAVQTCLGAASLLNGTGKHPEEEIDRVTTPMGCTIVGLNEMEHNGLSSALIKGLATSFERINQMKKPDNEPV
ncbi:pyrroline-5-carboxylate reductase [Fulvivirga sedimenti]|uniref:Pyrroline-5-carboxylate reductase n=1 Tax=Fulvivirga sedimenti TaxID=2879465 RepID=A0A9X1HSK4_9BACT|nr:pyrroline-5-carboxylate reductase [Fulvivirga sedimenti]MCA6075243.1 pyrroline-5-carboxylate reductase [Fulvivirga sedimenti]MCA6076420.1 pyrroline-5-carboxylate reductase [Fulvivirga sedimenti]MCA6077548.1 pyrroline-5-carboxylate reductase [Fulvivirga sedimenti]